MFYKNIKNTTHNIGTNEILKLFNKIANYTFEIILLQNNYGVSSWLTTHK